MTNINVKAGEWCPELTITSDVTTVTFPDEDLAAVEVIVIDTDGDRVRWTSDGTTPGPDHGWFVPNDGVDTRPTRRAADDQPTRSTVVKLWCSGTATACVQRGDHN